MKNKVLIVMPCDLPVPSVRGGAVSTLIESLLSQNELYGDVELWIFTNCCEESIAAEKLYAQTNFIHFIENPFFKVLDRIFFQSNRYLRKLNVVRQVKRVLKERDFDAVVLQNSGYLLNIFSDECLTNKYRGKIYYHLHNDVPNSASKKNLYNSQLILISNYLEKKLVECCGSGIKKNCLLLKNAIDVNRFLQTLPLDEVNSIKKKYGVEGKKILIFVGRIDPAKGIAELLDAVKKLDDGYVLLIVGSTNFGGSEKSKFEHVIESKCRKLGERVVFTGFVHNRELWKLYKIADVAVLPSVWDEPAGLTMLEASVSGLPLVTTRVGGIPEYINEKSAILVERNALLVQKLYTAIIDIFSNMDYWLNAAKENQEYYASVYNERLYYENFLKILGL